MSQTSGYTKGPWIWDAEVPAEYTREFFQDNAPWLVTENCDLERGQVLTGDIVCRNPSNLALIAAAPDLLEALKACHLQLLQSGCNHEYTQEACGMAVAAIAKAEGK